jgi:hypothetical protein
LIVTQIVLSYITNRKLTCCFHVSLTSGIESKGHVLLMECFIRFIYLADLVSAPFLYFFGTNVTMVCTVHAQDMGIREALMRAEKQLKLSKRKDWYKILGISKTASAADIKRAYKKLALQWHPDKNVDKREEAENMFREIAAAYEV